METPTYPEITVNPAVNMGAASVRGVPCWALAGQIWAGESVEGTAHDYDLTRAQVIAACWFLGAYGVEVAYKDNHGRHARPGGVWKKRWGAWANDAYGDLWHGDVDKVPDPPIRNARRG